MTDAAFLQQFESLTLPLEQWTHRAHLRLAYLYLTRHDLAVAVEKTRLGIQAHNAAHGILTTPTSGYHESQTMLWLRLVAATLAEYGPGPGSTADEFIDFHGQLSSPKLHRLYYSRNLFMSPEFARAAHPAGPLAPLLLGR